MQKQTYNSRKSQELGVLSADPRKAMQEMMDTIDLVRGVYERETDALERMDSKAFLNLQNEKIEATTLYKAGIENILQRKAEMKNIDPSLKQELRRMQSDFSELSSKNMNALKRMQKTMERLGNTIQKAAKDSVNKDRAVSYGNTGRLDKNENKSVSIGISESA